MPRSRGLLLWFWPDSMWVGGARGDQRSAAAAPPARPAAMLSASLARPGSSSRRRRRRRNRRRARRYWLRAGRRSPWRSCPGFPTWRECHAAGLVGVEARHLDRDRHDRPAPTNCWRPAPCPAAAAAADRPPARAAPFRRAAPPSGRIRHTRAGSARLAGDLRAVEGARQFDFAERHRTHRAELLRGRRIRLRAQLIIMARRRRAACRDDAGEHQCCESAVPHCAASLPRSSDSGWRSRVSARTRIERAASFSSARVRARSLPAAGLLPRTINVPCSCSAALFNRCSSGPT